MVLLIASITPSLGGGYVVGMTVAAYLVLESSSY